jgi:hypothetical protein
MNARSQSANSFQARPATSGKKVYAWLVSAGAVLMLGLLCWPLTVDRFHTTAGFQLDYDPSSRLEKVSLNEIVAETMREVTDRAALEAILSRLPVKITGELLKSGDAEAIRNALKIRFRTGTRANSVDYQISMTGSGGPDEIAFLNALVVRLNSAVGERIAVLTADEVINRLGTSFLDYHAGVMNQISGEIQSVIGRIDNARNGIQIAASDLSGCIAGDSAGPGQTASASPPAGGGELSRLKAEREALLRQPGMTPWHPEVTTLQRQIEALQSGMDSGQGGNSGAFQTVSTTSTRHVRNQFLDPRSLPESGAVDPLPPQPAMETVLGRIVDDIRKIDLDVPGQELAGIQTRMGESRESGARLVDRMIVQARNSMRSQAPVVMTGIQKASASQPVRGVPAGANFVFLCLCGAIVGSTVAIHYDPSLRRRRFRSLMQLQHKLHLPVLGVIRARPGEPNPGTARQRVAAWAVIGAEWTLLMIALCLILAALYNSQIGAAFLENPFHAVTRSVWILTSHG